MKKIFILTALCLSAVLSMAQSWDHLKKDLSLNKSNVTTINDSIKTPIYSTTPNKVLKGNFLGLDEYALQYDTIGYNYTFLPSPIVEEYKLGQSCYKSGCVTISLGVPLAVVGGILWGCYSSTSTKNQAMVDRGMLIAGEVLVGVGASLVSVSIPLLSFGDHMKRDANWQYRLHKK